MKSILAFGAFVLATNALACGGLVADDADGGHDGGAYVDSSLDSSLDASLDNKVPPPQLDTGLAVDVGAEVSTTCNPSTCPSGCCRPDGTCNTKPSTTSCGAEGSACLACPSEYSVCNKPGPGCNKGVVPQCNASTCDGCCVFIGNFGYCDQGKHPGACGHDGQACGNCGVGGTCVSQPSGGGVCVGSPA